MTTPQQPPSQQPRFEPKPGQDVIKLRPGRDFLNSSEEDLLEKADECLSRAGSGLDVPQKDFDDLVRLRLSLEAQACLAEVLRRRADKAAAQDRKRENRHFWIEIIVVALLIGAELWVSIYYGRLGIREGKEQAAILQDVKKSTADSAEAIQQSTASLKTLVAQQAESLRISQNEQAERAKKPRLQLYIGQIPLTAANGPFKPRVETDTSATFDIVVRNAGEATANKVIWRALVPPDVGLNSTPSATPANDLPDRPVHAFLYFQDLIPPKGYVETTITFFFPKGHAPFVVKFNASSPEITGETPLGLLPIFPRKPAN